MTIFSKIVAGEIPAYKVAENSNYLAFLDINPLTEGHLLVIPKKEVDYIFDLDNETYLGLQQFAKTIAIAMKEAILCNRIGVVVMGLDVPHVHIHLIPMNVANDLNFAKPKLILSKEEFIAIAKKIQAKLKN